MLMPEKYVKFSSGLPLRALMAQTLRSGAAYQSVGVFPKSLVVYCSAPSWRWSETPLIPLTPAVLCSWTGRVVVQMTIPLAALSANSCQNWVIA